MIPSETLVPVADVAPKAPAEDSPSGPDLSDVIGEWILRLVVVALGILGGGIIAVVVGLYTGWIEFVC